MHLRFDRASGGLTTTGKRPPGPFLVAGKDRRFVPANARIVGESIRVWAEAVPDPVAVRYAWSSAPEGTPFANRAGLPASSFRTDDWPAGSVTLPSDSKADQKSAVNR